MFSVACRMMKRFRREEKGVVLILVVLVIVPLLMVVAVGLDLGQSLVVKRQLSSAVDAAALAIGTDPDLTDETELNEKAEAFIKAHYSASDIGSLTSFSAVRTVTDEQDIQVDVSASADVATSFMKIGGIDKLTISANSMVVRRERDLEIVMVLDNSGSMSGSKITALKSAATTLVNILIGEEETSEDVSIGLVPFKGSVNIGVPVSTLWLDHSNPAPIEDYLDLAAGESIFNNVLATMTGGVAARWGGCVRSRPGGNDVLDTTPDSFVPSTLFPAHFKPFDGADPANYADSDSDEQNDNCPDAPVQTLTNTKATITSAIEAMEAQGNTNIAEGLAWGWRVLSADAPFIQGAPYSDQRAIKAIIVLTDGANSVDGENNFSSYGFGGSDNPDLGPNVNDELDIKTTEVCDNIKANHDDDTDDEDIRIYSIVFNVNSSSIIDLMEDCASKPEYFFNSPTETELQAAFQAIASGLNQLRIAE